MQFLGRKRLSQFCHPIFCTWMAFVLSSSAAWASNHAIVVGGNCDGKKPQNMFLSEMALSAKVLSSRGWDVEAYFDGSARDCQFEFVSPECQNKPPNPKCCPSGIDPKGWSTLAFKDHSVTGEIKDASTENFLSALDSAAAKLGPQDQLLIDIHTHGARRFANVAHSICMKDPKNSDELYVDDKRLQAKLEQLKKKGVKIAILDQSCYSGGSIEPLRRFGCVLAATEPESTSIRSVFTEAMESLKIYSDFATQFPNDKSNIRPIASQGPSSKFTLEDLYLASIAKANTYTVGKIFPQSSQMETGDSDLAELFLNSQNLKYREDGALPMNRITKLFCEVPDSQFQKIEAFLDEVGGIAKPKLNQNESNWVATVADLVSLPPQMPDLSRQESEFFHWKGEVKRRMTELNSAYSEFNRISDSLRQTTSVVASSIPADLEFPFMLALGARSSYATKNHGTEFEFDGFSFPNTKYEEIVNQTISKVKEKNPQSAAMTDWTKIQTDLLVAFKTADKNLSDSKRAETLNTRARLNSLSDSLARKETDLQIAQDIASLYFFVLKSAWLIKNRPRFEKTQAFRDCADFQLF